MSFLGYNSLVQPFKQDMPYIQYCAIKDWFDLYYISNEKKQHILFFSTAQWNTLLINLHLWLFGQGMYF